MRPIDWIPPVAWMAVIFVLSTDAGSAHHTGQWLAPVIRLVLPGATPAQVQAVHALIRKLAHLTEYAILAALWFRAFARGARMSPAAAGWAALGLSAAWAGLDELHQAFVASRGGNLADVLLDSTGAAAAVVAARAGWRAAARRATVALLWFAAAGGALALAIDAQAGVPSGILWVTTPVAALALLVGRRWARRR